jgi:integrase
LVLQWIDPDTGRRKSQSAKTSDPKEAEQARVDLEADLNNGRYLEASRMSWERFRELFEEEYLPNCRPRTRVIFQRTFDLFEQICSPRGLRSVTERTVSAFAAGLRKLRVRRGQEGMQASTIKVRLQFLHTALCWGADQKLIPACPTFPFVKVPRRRPQPIPAESVERLLAKAPDEHMRTYLLCGWLAGLRRNEALALEWQQTDEAPHLDLRRDRIILPANFVKAVEDQWVPLDPELRKALEDLPRYGRRVFRFLGTRGEPLSDCAVSCRISVLAHKAGVKLSMHSLRKGFGCRYAGEVSAQVLQRLMRHANIQTTMDYYANIDDAVEEAVFGPERNRLRNRKMPQSQDVEQADDASPDRKEITEDHS